eukprot:7100948-Pyramimonas_sp.AAC.1
MAAARSVYKERAPDTVSQTASAERGEGGIAPDQGGTIRGTFGQGLGIAVGGAPKGSRYEHKHLIEVPRGLSFKSNINYGLVN